MRKFSVVTTFNNTGYQRYASRMIDTFIANWPVSVNLHVYAEGTNVVQKAKNLHVYDCNTYLPALVKFKEKWQNDPRATGKLANGTVDRRGKQNGIGFKWDAVRFSHKVYAVCNLARFTDDDVVIWMDADTVCHSPIPLDFIESQFPVGTDIAFFGREKKYTECGLYALNVQSQVTQYFVELFQWNYDHAEKGIFTMSEWHDSWVFDQVRANIARKFPSWKQLDWSTGIITGEGHPLINSPWGAYLDHLKGDDRKDQGKSKASDLKVSRAESYWRDVS